MIPLLDNQEKAKNKLQQFKVGALFMEPGTGKTRTAIELIQDVYSSYILWLTPFKNISNIRNEISRWNHFQSLNSEIVGIESLSNSDKLYIHLIESLKKAHNPIIILDESLKIKNWEAKRTKRIIELSKLSQMKLILNGTPISRNLLDAWAQFEFLSPKILSMSLKEYKNTFCEYVTITTRVGSSRSYSKEFIVKYHNVDYLYSLIQPYVFEADLSLNVGKQYIDLDFTLDAPLMEEYQNIKKRYLNDETLQLKNNNIFLEVTQKLQHCYSLSSQKFELLEKIISTSDKSKIVVFRKYLDSDAMLKSRFPDIQIRSIQSESMGLNMQEFNTIVIWDKVWDYALVKQMEHRIYRTGQKEACRFINLNGNVNLEKMISDNLNRKCSLLDYFKSKTHTEGILEL